MKKPVLNAREILGPKDTAREMARLSKTYWADVRRFLNWPVHKFFRFVANLPYKPDPQNVEATARPKWALSKSVPFRDCDDKSVLLGAYFYGRGIPFVFVATSKRPDKRLHHVFPAIVRRDGSLIPTDATYPRNTLGSVEPFTRSELLTGVIQ